MTGRIWLLLAVTAVSAAAQQVNQLRTTFEVRYVAAGAVYLSGGREEGLQEGFHLTVKRIKPGEATLVAGSVAELVVTAVAAHSAACNIESSTVELQVGDTAQISSTDLEALQTMQQSKTVRHYAQVVTFTAGDPLELEQHDSVPRPPSPAVNHVAARFSYEFNSIFDHESHLQTFQNGMSARVDATRLGGTFWNFGGYWRGRFTNTSGSAQIVTLNDLLNRTYTIGFTYSSPQSPNSIGVGRLYLPWATSLGTIDGGYFARRFRKGMNVGIFGGSTPDPTAWDYKPNRQIAGVFGSLESGSFENVRFTGTAGLAITRLGWLAERQFAFTESMFSWKQYVSVYHNLEADQLVPGRLGNMESGVVVSRSFLTTRFQPWHWLSFDVSHNYFRTVPTFDLVLVGTGVLDRFLFAGLSGGLRVELPNRITLYGNIGQSKRNDDPRGSLNQMYGISVRNFLGSGFRADVRHSVFHGSFGNGWYQSVSASRDIGDRVRFEFIAGQQEFRSPFTSAVRGFFVNSNIDWFLSRHYILGGGINLFRGQQQNYDQTFFTLGYRL